MPWHSNKSPTRALLLALTLLPAFLLVTSSYAVTAARSPESKVTPLTQAPATADRDRLPATELNQGIERVLSAPEYAWRNPAGYEAAPSWVQQLGNWLKDGSASLAKALGRLMRNVTKWLENLFPKGPLPSVQTNDSMALLSQVLTWLVIAGAAVVLALILAKLINRKSAISPPTLAAPLAAPDLESESTTADELPEDEWLRLASEKASEGDLRQALRALFFAVLALLGTEGLVLIRKSKSNFDYERELKRKVGSAVELSEIFSSDRRLFERCWYGAHPATMAEFEQSTSLYQRLKHACLRK